MTTVLLCERVRESKQDRNEPETCQAAGCIQTLEESATRLHGTCVQGVLHVCDMPFLGLILHRFEPSVGPLEAEDVKLHLDAPEFKQYQRLS